MKVYLKDLKIETTLADVCSVFGYEEEDVIKGLSDNDNWFDLEDSSGASGWLSKDIDTDVINFNFSEGAFHEEIIDLINELEVTKNDPFLLIIKDEAHIDDEEFYISFEVLPYNIALDPPPLKGGEYEEKSLMTDKEIENLPGLEITDTKYQEMYFEKVKGFDPEKWTKGWMDKNAEDMKRWNV
jgi:hypothetical protein